ncbi:MULTISPECIES: hypothetical protein [Sorangium]|uniref:hypothetical protein n=1 Tax=Sorangium TaxID=39643 RepID=UPI0013E9C0F3|nr:MULTISPECIES: hypothetical protein [Sorangium]
MCKIGAQDDTTFSPEILTTVAAQPVATCYGRGESALEAASRAAPFIPQDAEFAEWVIPARTTVL